MEKQCSQLTVIEYNYKRTIYEYLTLLNSNNRRGRMDKENDQDISRTTCCARQVISLEPDFIAQKGAMEELIEKVRHKCIFSINFIVN